MTYVARRKSAKGRGKHDHQGQKDQHQHETKSDAIDETNSHNFVNEQRMKELSQRRGPHGLDLDGIR